MHKMGYVYNKAGLLKSVITNLIETNNICIIVSKGKITVSCEYDQEKEANPNTYFNVYFTQKVKSLESLKHSQIESAG